MFVTEAKLGGQGIEPGAPRAGRTFKKYRSMLLSNICQISEPGQSEDTKEIHHFPTSNSIRSAEMAGRPTNAAKTRKKNLARARQIRLEARRAPPKPSPSDTDTGKNGQADNESSEDDIKCTGWSGGVSHHVSSGDEPIIISDNTSEGEEEVEELSGTPELEEVLQGSETPEVTPQSGAGTDAYSAIMQKQTGKDWKKAESRRSLGYNGQSARTKRYHEQLARKKEEENAKLRNRWVGIRLNRTQLTHLQQKCIHRRLAVSTTIVLGARGVRLHDVYKSSEKTKAIVRRTLTPTPYMYIFK